MKKPKQQLTVAELIKTLKQVKDKNLLINCIVEDSNGNYSNNWVTEVEEHSTGKSGYEIEGEISLITSE
jgi:hypothetical protein